MSTQISPYCDVTPFSLVKVYRRLGKGVSLIMKEKRSTKFLVRKSLRDRAPEGCIMLFLLYGRDKRSRGCRFLWQFGNP
jgi:hypothetical protein